MAGVSKTGGVTGAACPRCGAELKPLVGAGYQAQSCRSCKGIWVDNEGSRSIAAGAGELIDCATLPPGERPNDTRAAGRCPKARFDDPYFRSGTPANAPGGS